MIRSLSTFLTDLRAEPRHALRHPCKLILDGIEISATLTEISLGGARIELPPQCISFVPSALRAVHIDHTGTLRAQERWRRHGTLGARFRRRDSRLRVAAWFEELGILDEVSPGG